MDSTPIIQFLAPKGELLEPPPSSHPILTDGYELRPTFIAMVQEQSFSRLEDENPYTHLREFEQLCSCLTIAYVGGVNCFHSPFWEEQNNGILIL